LPAGADDVEGAEVAGDGDEDAGLGVTGIELVGVTGGVVTVAGLPLVLPVQAARPEARAAPLKSRNERRVVRGLIGPR